MENERHTPEGRLSRELSRELEALREEMRNGLAVVQMDLKTVIRKLDWLASDSKGVRSDIEYNRQFTMADFRHLRTQLETLRGSLDRAVGVRRSPDDSAGSKGQSDPEAPGGGAS